MATAESAGKICIVCGKDVAGQPRVKDAAGRYLCAGECQKKALAAAKAKQGGEAKQQPGVVGKASAPTEPGGLLGQLIADSPMLKSATCESCGNPMPGGAVLCTRCGFNPATGKAIKTAVIVEKEKKEPKAPKVKGSYKGRYAASEFGPSFGVLFLIVFGTVAGLGALGLLDPMFAAAAFAIGFICYSVGYIWGIVTAFRDGETMWGICAFLPVVSLGFVYYLIFVNEDKWSKALFLGSVLGLLTAVAVVMGMYGFEDFMKTLNG